MNPLRSPSCAARAVLVFSLAVGCGTPVDPEPLGDYTQWPVKLETYGPAPGHGDTYRVIYANQAAAQTRPASYARGVVVVKEIRTNNDGAAGELQYVAIMRKLEFKSDPEQGDWMFTESETPGGAEVAHDFCWSRCHVVAPHFGVWFNYAAPR